MSRAEAPSTHPTPTSAGAAGDYVFTFSYESYADASKRGMMRPPDRLVSRLMTSPDVRRLLIADPFRSSRTRWGRAILDIGNNAPVDDRIRHVAPERLEKADPTDLAEIEATYRAYESAVRAAADTAGLVRPRFITANPLVGGFSALDWAGPALYYGRDDWLSSPARKRYWPAYEEAYRRIAASGRAVAAVSEEIIERIAPTGPHAVVPNGIDPDEWLGPQPEPPSWFAKIPGPRAVYVGTLDSRLDTEGLSRLATSRPDLHIVLVGPRPDRSYLAELRTHPNVHVHRDVKRRAISAILRNAELTLLAHRRTPLTEAMSPLKLYEYLAAGRAVLATDLRPVRGLGDRVLVADSVSDFADLVDPALALGIESEPRRRAFVDENAWSARHERILALLRT
ncbi:glycosyltransferase [Agromyces protaetiae]|uniref:Glycosyltransferase n=1 Tax=Agromyces protaetiae TaxID=2509455 RepID=A0A4P6FEJ2_9MICO|nr:glycosyltransferase [Agromyces protaetiae]QAY74680.1 glycosyltransferase [Agromyces protaetiae]